MRLPLKDHSKSSCTFEQNLPRDFKLFAVMANQTLTSKRTRMLPEIQNLPPEIIQDILSRLPISTLYQSRYVCKPWQSLINSPQMPTMHYKHSSQNPPNPTTLLLVSSQPHQTHNHLHYMPDLYTCKQSTNLPKLPFQSWLPNFSIVGSCNGFICLADFTGSYRSLFISNPVSGDCFKLPDAPDFGQIKGNFFGFGYDRKNNEYKVIRRRFSKTRNDLIVEIVTVGRNSWRTIEPTVKIRRGKGSSKAFVNGCLHWLAICENVVMGIVSFNVEKEEFGVVPINPFMQSIETQVAYFGLLGGFLCVTVNFNKTALDVWLMKDYGVKDSWVREFSIPRTRKYKNMRPLQMQNNGNILLEGDGNALFSYDPKTRTRKKLKVDGLPTSFVAFPHAGTLVKLKDVVSIEES